MDFTISDLIAIYAAIVSTFLAIYQFKQIQLSRRFICIEHQRISSWEERSDKYYDEYEFYLSNRGHQPTTITEFWITEYRYNVFGHKLIGTDNSSWNLENTDNPSIPIKMQPGETITLNVSLKEVENCSLPEMEWEEGTRKPIRYLRVKHSQSKEEIEHKFDISEQT